MFPWLFPYGLGGMGNECIPSDVKISDAVRKKHWLMYHEKRFQHDELFSDCLQSPANKEQPDRRIHAYVETKLHGCGSEVGTDPDRYTR